MATWLHYGHTAGAQAAVARRRRPEGREAGGQRRPCASARAPQAVWAAVSGECPGRTRLIRVDPNPHPHPNPNPNPHPHPHPHPSPEHAAAPDEEVEVLRLVGAQSLRRRAAQLQLDGGAPG